MQTSTGRTSGTQDILMLNLAISAGVVSLVQVGEFSSQAVSVQSSEFGAQMGDRQAGEFDPQLG